MAFLLDTCESQLMPTARLIVTTTKKLAPAVSAALFAAGAQGLEERPGRSTVLVAYAEARRHLASLWKRTERVLLPQLGSARMPRVAIEVDAVERWRTEWTEHLRPVRLTPRLLLAPTTCDSPALRASQKLILYQPALAFGDGDHATTRLAAQAVERHYRSTPGGALLDLGTGTGVLSFVAALSGARRAVGTDTDPAAVCAARLNASLNGLAKRTRFIDASARISGRFDLLVVNIELRPLLQLLASLPTAARRAPRLLVTGFLRAQLSSVTAAVQAAGFRPTHQHRAGDWVLLDASPST